MSVGSSQLFLVREVFDGEPVATLVSPGVVSIDACRVREWGVLAELLAQALAFPAVWGRGIGAVSDGIRDLSWWPSRDLAVDVAVNPRLLTHANLGLLVLTLAQRPEADDAGSPKVQTSLTIQRHLPVGGRWVQAWPDVVGVDRWRYVVATPDEVIDASSSPVTRAELDGRLSDYR